jgi:hypothetical protein
LFTPDRTKKTMKTHHADNVRIKHKYLGYLKEAKGHAEASLDSVAQALDRFENYISLPGGAGRGSRGRYRLDGW